MIIRALFIVLITLLSVSPAISGTRHPSTPDEKYVEYGKKFHYIVQIVAFDKDTSKPQVASGVLIAPHWALTAAHVVYNTKDVGILMGEKKDYVKTPVVIPHKDFDPNGQPGFYDIALCYSERNFGLDFYPELYSDGDEEGKICSISGYGLNGTFTEGVNKADATRRAGSNKVERVELGILFCTPSNKNRTELEYLICPGDSGGGLFIGNKLAGINSFVQCDTGKMPNSNYDSEAGHVRVSLYRDWVKLQIEQHELTATSGITTSAEPEKFLEK